MLRARSHRDTEVEELIHGLKKRFTIAIVTHNLQQAKRVADATAFLYVDTHPRRPHRLSCGVWPNQGTLPEPPRETHPGLPLRNIQLTRIFHREERKERAERNDKFLSLCVLRGESYELKGNQKKSHLRGDAGGQGRSRGNGV